ncbi:MAG: DUF1127 domain-containing protein [Proteobacteria bacterium]|nr:DUF1127 domain-containing protein [Pseudomonadota bacterium]
MSQIKPSVFHRIASALAAWRRQRQDLRQMMSMSDAELRDLGIGRGQIPALLETAPSSSAAWHAATRPVARARRMPLDRKTA